MNEFNCCGDSGDCVCKQDASLGETSYVQQTDNFGPYAFTKEIVVIPPASRDRARNVLLEIAEDSATDSEQRVHAAALLLDYGL